MKRGRQVGSPPQIFTKWTRKARRHAPRGLEIAPGLRPFDHAEDVRLSG